MFPNKDGRLTPGQFARVRLPVGEKYRGLLVNDQAIGIDQGQKYLLIVNKENKAEYRPVTPGRLEKGLRVFPPGSGLEPGAQADGRQETEALDVHVAGTLAGCPPGIYRRLQRRARGDQREERP